MKRLGALVVLGCGGEVATTARQLPEILVSAKKNDTSSVDACEALPSPQDRGWCVAQVVDLITVPWNPSAACARVEDPIWRGECYFVVAEDAVNRGDLDAGIAACALAGALATDCARHLWEAQQIRDKGRIEEHRQAIAAGVPGSGPSLDSAEAPLAERVQVVRGQEFVNADQVDVSPCGAALDPDGCVQAAVGVLERRWRRALDDRALRETVCRSGQVPADHPRLRWAPHPSLDAAVATVMRDACVGTLAPRG